FEERGAIDLMEPGNSGSFALRPADAVRPMTPEDLPVVEALSRRIYKSSRRGDAALALAAGHPAFVRERGGWVAGYVIPGLLGHGVATTNDDVLNLLRAAVRPLPSPFDRGFAPLSNVPLFPTLPAASP